MKRLKLIFHNLYYAIANSIAGNDIPWLITDQNRLNREIRQQLKEERKFTLDHLDDPNYSKDTMGGRLWRYTLTDSEDLIANAIGNNPNRPATSADPNNNNKTK